MIKKILILLLIVNCYLLIVDAAIAASPTPGDKIQEIRDRLITNIASRVAQLKLVERRGIIGTVTDVTNTQITIMDSNKNTRFIDVDELTKFSSPKAKSAFGISDISKDTTVGVLGLYNKESRRILARFVNVVTAPTIIHGGVSAINSDDFSLNITTEEGKLMTVDVENLTRTYSYAQEKGYVKSGFSKIKENYNIIVGGVLDVDSENRLTATRIIFFPEIPISPKVNSMLNKINKSSK